MEKEIMAFIEKLKSLQITISDCDLSHLIGFSEGLKLATNVGIISDCDIMEYELPMEYTDIMMEIMEQLEDDWQRNEWFHKIRYNLEYALGELEEKYGFGEVLFEMNEPYMRLYFFTCDFLNGYSFDEKKFIENVKNHYENLYTQEKLDFETYLRKHESEIKDMLINSLSHSNLRMLIDNFKRRALEILNEYKRRAEKIGKRVS